MAFIFMSESIAIVVDQSNLKVTLIDSPPSSGNDCTAINLSNSHSCGYRIKQSWDDDGNHIRLRRLYMRMRFG